MKKYPYLAKYNNTSQYEDVILWMLEPHSGRIVYIPPDMVAGDPRFEISILEPMSPSNSEIDDYSGAVVLRSSSVPTLLT